MYIIQLKNLSIYLMLIRDCLVTTTINSLRNGFPSSLQLWQLPTVWTIPLHSPGCPGDLDTLVVKPLDFATVIITTDHVT